MPNKRQVITSSNADPIHWRKYAALGGDELTHGDALIHQTINIWYDKKP